MNEPTAAQVVGELIRSYTLQAGLYRKLDEVVQKLCGQLVLSRGNLSAVKELFEEKQRLLDAITSERERTRGDADVWQREKATAAASVDAARLDAVLSETQNIINSFLNNEQQLERYLQHLIGKGNPSDT